MAEYSGFFDGDQLYGQDEFNRYFSNIYRSGISVNEDNTMTFNCYTSGNNLIIGKGFAIVKGFYLYSDIDKTVTISRAVNYNRIDRVVIKLDLVAKKVVIDIKKGVESSNPVPPSLQRDEYIYELSLCQMLVPPTGNMVITDERYKTELCGAIRPRDTSEIDTMIIRFTENWEAWFNQQQSTGWRKVYIQEGTPVDSVVGSIWLRLI